MPPGAAPRGLASFNAATIGSNASGDRIWASACIACSRTPAFSSFSAPARAFTALSRAASATGSSLASSWSESPSVRTARDTAAYTTRHAPSDSRDHGRRGSARVVGVGAGVGRGSGRRRRARRGCAASASRRPGCATSGTTARAWSRSPDTGNTTRAAAAIAETRRLRSAGRRLRKRIEDREEAALQLRWPGHGHSGDPHALAAELPRDVEQVLRVVGSRGFRRRARDRRRPARARPAAVRAPSTSGVAPVQRERRLRDAVDRDSRVGGCAPARATARPACATHPR